MDAASKLIFNAVRRYRRRSERDAEEAAAGRGSTRRAELAARRAAAQARRQAEQAARQQRELEAYRASRRHARAQRACVRRARVRQVRRGQQADIFAAMMQGAADVARRLNGWELRLPVAMWGGRHASSQLYIRAQVLELDLAAGTVAVAAVGDDWADCTFPIAEVAAGRRHGVHNLEVELIDTAKLHRVSHAVLHGDYRVMYYTVCLIRVHENTLCFSRLVLHGEKRVSQTLDIT